MTPHQIERARQALADYDAGQPKEGELLQLAVWYAERAGALAVHLENVLWDLEHR